jgi:hypothetical protein
MNFNELKIFIVECPYDTWDQAPTQELFGKMVSLKLSGFRARHAYGVMPVDIYDYIATHLLVCEQTPQGLRVLMGYKTISYDRCKTHRVPFPMLAVFGKSPEAREHEQETQAILSRCETQGIPLAYTGSWTLDPAVRKDKGLADDLRSIFEAMYVFCPETYGFRELICGCVPRLKTDLLLEEWGQKRATKQNGELLPPVSVSHLQGDQVVMMHLKGEFTASVRARVERWRSLWESRTVVAVQNAEVIPLKKVA